MSLNCEFMIFKKKSGEIANKNAVIGYRYSATLVFFFFGFVFRGGGGR